MNDFPDTRMSDIGEAGALELIAPFLAADGEIEVGYGDDTAAVRLPDGSRRLYAADMMVEGVHFLAIENAWSDIGAKAININLSDIAAMGGEPEFALLSIGLPPEFRQSDLRELYRGMKEVADDAGLKLIGGDTVRADKIVVNVAVTGRAPGDRPLPLRSRCKPGQTLYLTGPVGDSAAGLALLTNPEYKKFRDEPWAQRLIQRHRRATHRLELGRQLVAAIDDLAMIDISDGVAHDARRLAQASNCGIEINPEALPISADLKTFAKTTSQSPTQYTLHGGEDFELLVCSSTRSEKEEVSMLFPIGTTMELMSDAPRFSGLGENPSNFEHFSSGPK